MSDLDLTHDNSAEMAAVELEALKTKADQLGVTYHPSISAAKLSEKIKKHLEGSTETVSLTKEPAHETPGQLAKRIQMEALKLVRVNITCMDPQKTEHDGEIFTVGNSVIPTQRKFVPFNTPNGFHIPQIMLDMLKAKECQVFYTERNASGNSVRKAKQIRAFSIEILPPLTDKELKELAASQAASGMIV
jgi:hypothetical protein